MSHVEFPSGLMQRGQTPLFTEATTPAKLIGVHTTKAGVWGKLVVFDGVLDFVVPGPPSRCQRVDAGSFAVIEPTVPHHVRLIGPVSFRIEFHRLPSNGDRSRN